MSARASTPGGIVKTNLFGGFKIYDELKLRRLLDGQIGSLGSFQYLVDVYCGATIQISNAHAVAHQLQPLRPRPPDMLREARLYREVGYLFSLRRGDATRHDHEDCVSSSVACVSEGSR